ncbi:DNA mismatch repair protein MutL [Lactobacillus helveticus]|uniref:DNA mismatch repair protein MutL n=1 Tax=Lactobacillus helveticus TaxID=1587 RepID=A0A386RD34_LACHE|nr:DNA mismatch repair endonuclease MutL [Lactobacillus helveticus]AYE60959.1 DNA mismatch repair protein MutL [Lactobacillus helveticus]MCD9224158.1 DNA mismatch repair endonuclease MutL [Lactobacillus helveticus]
MAKIHELSENLTNQIAAGEVIERPASVVKELVENSLDAGATRIRVDFIDAGLKQIVVQDNGTGIARDQVDLAFTRHATSKISNEYDLFKVSTLGFRGEALASISAVSHVEIVTATENAIGIKADFSGGSKKGQEDAASQKGTKITVRDLFFNTPARLKYLRSPRTEIMKIVDIINRLSLGYPHVSFTLSNTGKVLFRTTGNGNLKQTVANVYGRHIAEKMESFEAKDSDFKITGLMSKPELTRSTRNFISILLNGRYIKNFQLNNAIMDGYGSKLAARHYPIVVIAIHVDPMLVDVNVHPTKQEVRLSKEKELSRLITGAISDALLDKTEQSSGFANLENKRETLVDQLEFNLNQDVVNTTRKTPEVHEEAEKPEFLVKQEAKNSEELKNETEHNYVDINIPREDDQYIITKTWDKNVALQQKLMPFSNKKVDQEVISTGDETLANNLPRLAYVGKIDTYLLAENDGDLYLIDQVAARRRLQFEQIYQTITSKKIVQQGLLTPIVLEFGNLDFLQIKDKIYQIKQLGIYLDEFGQNSFIVRSYPTWIHDHVEESIREILDNYLNLDKGKTQNLFKRVAALEAKRSVKGKINLSAAEGTQIITDLRKTSDPYHDADGRLILVRISQNELRKMFKKGE